MIDVTVAAFEGSPMKLVMIPLWLASGLAWMFDRYHRAGSALYGVLGHEWKISNDVIDVNGLRMCAPPKPPFS